MHYRANSHHIHFSDCLPLRCAAVDPRYSHLRSLADSLRRDIRQELEDEISSLGIDRTEKAKEYFITPNFLFLYTVRIA